MKLKVRTLNKEIFSINVQPNDTILNVKGKIKHEKRVNAELQKIFVKGKLTKNQTTIKELELTEDQFIVMMVSTVKTTQNSKIQPTGKNDECQQQLNPNLLIQEKMEEKLVFELEVDHPEIEQKIMDMMSMGFERQSCWDALKMANFDEMKASDSLIGDICLQKKQKPTHISQNEQNLMRKLMQKNSIRQIRSMIMLDRSVMQPILNQIERISPQLYALILKYPETFEKILVEDFPHEHQKQKPRIRLNQEQKDFIKKMIEFGYKKNESVKAFLKCKKDEGETLNYLQRKNRQMEIRMKRNGEQKERKKEEKDNENKNQQNK